MRKQSNYKSAWLVQLVSHERWKNWHSLHGTYCFMRKCEDGVWMGYIGNDISPLPPNTHKANMDELKQIHQFRLNHNVRPLPFDKDDVDSTTDYPQEEVEHKKNMFEGLSKLKSWVRKQSWFRSVRRIEIGK